VDDDGSREGAPADPVVLDAPCPEWAIVDRAARTHVLKNGRVVARDGVVARGLSRFGWTAPWRRSANCWGRPQPPGHAG